LSTKNVQLITLITFIGLLCLPLLDWLTPLQLAKDYDITREKRALVGKPIFQIKKLESYPKSFDDYVNDNIPYREDILTLNSTMGFNFATKSSSRGAFEGLGGFYFSQKYKSSFENKKLLNSTEVDSLRTMFSYRSQYLQKKDIPFYVVVIPVKSNVYPEMMPKTTYRRNNRSITDQFLEVLNEIDGIETIDLRKPFLENKKSTGIRTFHKTDQHWNEYGAFLAYAHTINTIAKKYDGIKKINIQNYRVDSTLIKGKHCVKVLGLEDKVKEMAVTINFGEIHSESHLRKLENPYPSHEKFKYAKQAYYNYVSKNENNLKILWIRDSYANAMKRIFKMEDAVTENVLIWDNWCYRLNENIVEKEQPDIYVLMLIESNIPYIIHKHPSERIEKR
jgi:alginate O-acetyltransferase complex protein AlgJ